MKITFIVIVIIVIMLLVVILLCVEKVPPQALTRTRMIVIERQIRDYVTTQHHLPNSLFELPKSTNNQNHEFIDGWGHKIQYEKKGRTVTLLSFGKNGRQDENPQDDIKIIFTIPDY